MNQSSYVMEAPADRLCKESCTCYAAGRSTSSLGTSMDAKL